MPNKPRGVGLAWVEEKSYNIGMVCITGMSATAGNVSKSLRGHND